MGHGSSRDMSDMQDRFNRALNVHRECTARAREIAEHSREQAERSKKVLDELMGQLTREGGDQR